MVYSLRSGGCTSKSTSVRWSANLPPGHEHDMLEDAGNTLSIQCC